MLLHALITASRANGPGLRAVVFLQGCLLACPGCWNQPSHAFEGTEIPTEALAKKVLQAQLDNHLDGVTFSGGEPLQQADSLLALMRFVRSQTPELNFGMFSGYTERELDEGRFWVWNRQITLRGKQRLWRTIRAHLDFAVLGRFNPAQPGNLPLRTSRNQVLRFFSNRYSEADFNEQFVEVHVDNDGHAELTGFPIRGLPL